MKQIPNTPQITLAKQLHAAIEKAQLVVPIECEKGLYRGSKGGKLVQSRGDAEWMKENIGPHSIVNLAFAVPNLTELLHLFPDNMQCTTYQITPDTVCQWLIESIEAEPVIVRAHWKTLAENQ